MLNILDKTLIIATIFLIGIFPFYLSAQNITVNIKNHATGLDSSISESVRKIKINKKYTATIDFYFKSSGKEIFIYDKKQEEITVESGSFAIKALVRIYKNGKLRRASVVQLEHDNPEKLKQLVIKSLETEIKKGTGFLPF